MLKRVYNKSYREGGGTFSPNCVERERTVTMLGFDGIHINVNDLDHAG